MTCINLSKYIYLDLSYSSDMEKCGFYHKLNKAIFKTVAKSLKLQHEQENKQE